MFRKAANSGVFSGLKVPMQLKQVDQIAQKAGVGLNGVKVKIVRDPSLIGKGVYGYAEGKTITLYPDAFTNTETLVKTLGHERTHIYQFSVFGPATDSKVAKAFEQGAWGSESSWWTFYNRK